MKVKAKTFYGAVKNVCRHLHGCRQHLTNQSLRPWGTISKSTLNKWQPLVQLFWRAWNICHSTTKSLTSSLLSFHFGTVIQSLGPWQTVTPTFEVSIKQARVRHHSQALHAIYHRLRSYFACKVPIVLPGRFDNHNVLEDFSRSKMMWYLLRVVFVSQVSDWTV